MTVLPIFIYKEKYTTEQALSPCLNAFSRLLTKLVKTNSSFRSVSPNYRKKRLAVNDETQKIILLGYSSWVSAIYSQKSLWRVKENIFILTDG